jgi:hypothetical protein
MKSRERLKKAIGKLQRRIGRTERMQAIRRSLVARLRDESAPGWRELTEFHLDTRIDDDPRARANERARARRS